MGTKPRSRPHSNQVNTGPQFLSLNPVLLQLNQHWCYNCLIFFNHKILLFMHQNYGKVLNLIVKWKKTINSNVSLFFYFSTCIILLLDIAFGNIIKTLYDFNLFIMISIKSFCNYKDCSLVFVRVYWIVLLMEFSRIDKQRLKGD